MLLTKSEGVEYHATVREMAVDDRPRERLQYYGPEALQTAELLAYICIRIEKGYTSQQKE